MPVLSFLLVCSMISLILSKITFNCFLVFISPFVGCLPTTIYPSNSTISSNFSLSIIAQLSLLLMPWVRPFALVAQSGYSVSIPFWTSDKSIESTLLFWHFSSQPPKKERFHDKIINQAAANSSCYCLEWVFFPKLFLLFEKLFHRRILVSFLIQDLSLSLVS